VRLLGGQCEEEGFTFAEDIDSAEDGFDLDAAVGSVIRKIVRSGGGMVKKQCN